MGWFADESFEQDVLEKIQRIQAEHNTDSEKVVKTLEEIIEYYKQFKIKN